MQQAPKKPFKIIPYPILKRLQSLKAWQFLYKCNKNDAAYDKITKEINEFKTQHKISP